MAQRNLWEQAPGDLYRVLGVSPTASQSHIHDAWRHAAKRTHPDLGGDQSRFQAVHIAYLVLSEPTERARYDRARILTAPPPPNDEFPKAGTYPALAAKRKHLVWLAILAAVLAVALSYVWPAFTIVAGVICGVIVTVGYMRLIHGRTGWR